MVFCLSCWRLTMISHIFSIDALCRHVYFQTKSRSKSNPHATGSYLPVFFFPSCFQLNGHQILMLKSIWLQKFVTNEYELLRRRKRTAGSYRGSPDIELSLPIDCICQEYQPSNYKQRFIISFAREYTHSAGNTCTQWNQMRSLVLAIQLKKKKKNAKYKHSPVNNMKRQVIFQMEIDKKKNRRD